MEERVNCSLCKKNAFTLVEVLAVVVILGIIVLIFVPNTKKILNENNTKIYKIKEKELIKAAADYVNYDKNFNFPTIITEKYVTMPQLIAGSYMNKILSTSTGEECIAFVRVTKSDVYGYNYEACLICDEYTSNKDFCSMAVYGDL